MKECPFFEAGLCDGELPAEKEPGIGLMYCIAMRYRIADDNHFNLPMGAEKLKSLPDNAKFLCNKDQSHI